jgi:hypothetical protein
MRRPRFLRPLVVACGTLAVLPAWAARPMITDDARLVDAKACQVESWVRHNRDSTEFWALPSCNFTGNLELTLGGARTREAGRTQTTDVQAQGKTLLRHLDTNGWGLGLAAGTIGHPDGRSRDVYGYVPASFSYLDDRIVLHTNLGALRNGEERRTHLTWGLATETQLASRTWLIAEIFRQGEGAPFHQLGLRHWIVPNRVQVDATYGNRIGGPGGESWFSLGLRLLTPSFLP